MSGCLFLKPQGTVMCSCRGSRWHGDSSSTHGPLKWCIVCQRPGVGNSGGLWEKKPKQLGGHLPDSQSQPTICQQRAADFLLRWTGHCPGPQDSYGCREFPSFSAVFPSTNFARITLLHEGLQHVAWAVHHRDIPRDYMPLQALLANSVMVSLLWEKVEGKGFSCPPKRAFLFTPECVILNTAGSSVWPFPEDFSFTESAKSNPTNISSTLLSIWAHLK